MASRVRDRVRCWASAVTGDPDDAEDVTQQVLLTLYARAGDFDGRSRFATWLYAITQRAALDRRRTDARRRTLLARQSADDAPPTSDDALADDAAVRLAALVRLYFAELTPRQRHVFELSDVHGLNSAEVAAQLGIAPATARVLLMRARRAIRLRILEHHAALLEEYRS